MRHSLAAVIDIGSNSVRLLIDRGLPVQYKQTDTTRLAEGLAASGVLNEAAMARTLEAVVRFFHAALDAGAARVYIFATEAVRAAKNGGEFTQRISDALFVPVQVLSGLEEARLGFLGAAGEDPACVLDVGGASVELSAGNAQRFDYCKSLPLGTVRLKEGAGDGRAAIERFIDARIDGFGSIQTDRLTGIGGTATSLAAMFLRQKAYDPAAVHGCTLTVSELEGLTGEIFACKDIAAAFPVIGKKRAAVIGHGALMVLALMRYTNAQTLCVSERDNMEGYLILKNLCNP